MQDTFEGFSCLRILTNFAEIFTKAMKAKRTCFISFIKLSFCILTRERRYTKRIYLYFNFFFDTVNSHSLETANHIAHIIFLLYSVMKTHLFINQNAHTINYLNYFNKYVYRFCMNLNKQTKQKTNKKINQKKKKKKNNNKK